MMRHAISVSIGLVGLVVLGALAMATAARADIVSSGDVDPADPSTWTSSTAAYIGYTDTADPGQVEVSGGSDLLSSYAYLGNDTGTSGTVTVDGAGSSWINRYDLLVGYKGEGTLSITDGGAISDYGGYVGGTSVSTGEVTVDGAGSSWTNSGGLHVGLSGNGTVTITDGGAVSSNSGVIGQGSSSTGEVAVDGAGSSWTSGPDLYVGYEGDGKLSITDGAEVSSGCCQWDSNYIGYSPGSRGEVTVSGEGATWTNGGDLYVGWYGDGSLTIADGGTVSVGAFTYAAVQDGSTGSIDFGTGGGTLTTRDIFLSASQFSGTGTINARGIVSDTDLVLDGGGSSISTFSPAIPSQDGGLVTLNLDLSDTVGYLGAGYQGTGSLAIQNGAAASSSHGSIGAGSGSTGTVTVDGAGSTWTNNYLYVGESGNGVLKITYGGAVSSDTGYIAVSSRGMGAVTVDGAGSTWTNSGYLYVGRRGDGTLSITDGGTVSSTDGQIGSESGSTGSVTVDGAGSTWTNSSDLSVGYEGSGTLTISDGGVVSNTSGSIGGSSYLHYSATGEVTVAGVGSTWTNSADLHVGVWGSATLTITGGGLVSVAGTLTLDFDADGDSFVNMATGGMLALAGDADDSIAEFLSLIDGTDAIRYWDAGLADWAPITAATYGDDYTLRYLTTGDLAGYTLLTVGVVPEPASLYLLCIGLAAMLLGRRR